MCVLEAEKLFKKNVIKLLRKKKKKHKTTQQNNLNKNRSNNVFP